MMNPSLSTPFSFLFMSQKKIFFHVGSNDTLRINHLSLQKNHLRDQYKNARVVQLD